ncbi:hypothetical protein LZD49_12475 [Dyadobacter sp. CY261]|uniref:hypothetical protein n=1 Tax=Dyadobacter sp. CY261 TaxID=2907203 RepID=UPI001F26FC12|nr:hypothetical protein [Dyadobacter sp. CY261]MCF0071288.1 hypothetical protein [Dyadobacter sp. CY261]
MDKEYCLQAMAWQKSEDYTEGLRLWKQRYGENLTYRTLCFGANDFTRAKMLAGLMEGVIAPDPEPKPEPAKAEPHPDLDRVKDEVSDLDWEVSDLRGKVEDLEGKLDELTGANLRPEAVPAKSENEPQEIQEMRRKTRLLMDERVILKQQLRELPDPEYREDRRKIAVRILDMTDELDMLFAKINYFREHGRVPEEIVVAPDVLKLPKPYLNIRTYISKTIKKINLAKEPAEKKKLEDVLQKWRDKLAEIETEL